MGYKQYINLIENAVKRYYEQRSFVADGDESENARTYAEQITKSARSNITKNINAIRNSYYSSQDYNRGTTKGFVGMSAVVAAASWIYLKATGQLDLDTMLTFDAFPIVMTTYAALRFGFLGVLNKIKKSKINKKLNSLKLNELTPNDLTNHKKPNKPTNFF